MSQPKECPRRDVPREMVGRAAKALVDPDGHTRPSSEHRVAIIPEPVATTLDRLVQDATFTGTSQQVSQRVFGAYLTLAVTLSQQRKKIEEAMQRQGKPSWDGSPFPVTHPTHMEIVKPKPGKEVKYVPVNQRDIYTLAKEVLHVDASKIASMDVAQEPREIRASRNSAIISAREALTIPHAQTVLEAKVTATPDGKVQNAVVTRGDRKTEIQFSADGSTGIKEYRVLPGSKDIPQREILVTHSPEGEAKVHITNTSDTKA